MRSRSSSLPRTLSCEQKDKKLQFRFRLAAHAVCFKHLVRCVLLLGTLSPGKLCSVTIAEALRNASSKRKSSALGAELLSFHQNQPHLLILLQLQ